MKTILPIPLSARITEVPISPRSIDPYASFDPRSVERLKTLGERLRNRRILHINSTERGGGVAKILLSQVALERGLTLDAHWFVIHPEDPEFFRITKDIHDAFHGKPGDLPARDLRAYEEESARLSRSLAPVLRDLQPDLIVVHDPQPLSAVANIATAGKKILRLHIELQGPPLLRAWFCATISSLDRVIVSRSDIAAPCIPEEMRSVISPAIDPLAEGNRPISVTNAAKILRDHGIDPSVPIVVQVARFDVWKDQIGTIRAFQRAQKDIPGMQLILAGFIEASDDPDSLSYLRRLDPEIRGNTSIMLFSDPRHLQNVSIETFVNALQQMSTVVIQKSLREGFGLAVTEALWKGKPVIGGNAGGIRLQIENGVNGILVRDAGEAASALIRLLRDPNTRDLLGRNAQESVRKRYLLPRYLMENLEVYDEVIDEE